jgi:O-antigen/teichoic acid export membrane protein
LSANKEYIGYAKDVGLVAGAQIATALLRFVQLPLLTKWLGTSLYGTWSMLWITITLVTPLAMLGLLYSTVRFLAAETSRDKIREGFFSVFVVVLASTMFFAVMLVLSSNSFASSLIGDANKSYLVKIASLMIFSQTIRGISVNFFRTFRQMKWYSALMLAKGLVEVGLMAWFLSMDWELTGVIIAVLASDSLCIAIALYSIIKQIGFQLPKFNEIKSYLRYGLPLAPINILSWLLLSCDRYIIGYDMTEKDVGIYAAACGLANVLGLFLDVSALVLFPTIAKSYGDGEIEKTKTYLKYSLKYLMLLYIPATFGLSVLASPLLRIFTTAEFASGSIVIPFMAFGLVFFGLYSICSQILLTVKGSSWIVRLLGISAALNIGLNLLLIPRLGILGAAWSALIAYGVLGILTLIISFRYLKFDLSPVSILKSILAAAVMALVIWLIHPSGVIMVVVSILLGIVVYSVMIMLLKGFNKNELVLFKDLIPGLSHRKK